MWVLWKAASFQRGAISPSLYGPRSQLRRTRPSFQQTRWYFSSWIWSHSQRRKQERAGKVCQVPNICADCCAFFPAFLAGFGEEKLWAVSWLNPFRIPCWMVLAQTVSGNNGRRREVSSVGKTISLTQCTFKPYQQCTWRSEKRWLFLEACNFGFCSFFLTQWITCNTCSHIAISSDYICDISTSFSVRSIETVEMKRLFGSTRYNCFLRRYMKPVTVSPVISLPRAGFFFFGCISWPRG